MHAVLGEAKPLLHNRCVFTNPQHCATVLGQASRRHLGDLVTLKLNELSFYGHGHVYLMIETLVLMDLRRGRSWPLARLPLGQGAGSEQLHPLIPSGWSVLVFQPSWRVYTRSNLEYGEHLPFLCLVDAGTWRCLTTGITTTLPMC